MMWVGAATNGATSSAVTPENTHQGALNSASRNTPPASRVDCSRSITPSIALPSLTVAFRQRNPASRAFPDPGAIRTLQPSKRCKQEQAMITDLQGNPLAGATPEAAHLYDQALECFNTYR